MLDIPPEATPPAQELREPPAPAETADEDDFWADIPVSIRESVGAYDSDTAGGCG